MNPALSCLPREGQIYKDFSGWRGARVEQSLALGEDQHDEAPTLVLLPSPFHAPKPSFLLPGLSLPIVEKCKPSTQALFSGKPKVRVPSGRVRKNNFHPRRCLSSSQLPSFPSSKSPLSLQVGREPAT